MPASQSSLFSSVVAISTTAGDISVTVPSGTTLLLIRKAGAFSDLVSADLGANAGNRVVYETDGNLRFIECWQIDAPAAGAQTVSLRTAGGSRDFYVRIDALSGVSTTARTPATVGSYGADRSVTLTTVAGDLVFDVITADASLALADGRTSQYIGSPAIDAGGNVGMSTAIASGTSTTMGWTHTAGFTTLAAVAYPESASGGGSSDDGLPPWFFLD